MGGGRLTIAGSETSGVRAGAPLRILQYIDTGGPGGAEAVFIRLSRALAERGHHVHTVVDDDTWLAATLRGHGLEVTPISSSEGLHLKLLTRLRRHMRLHRYDVVHTHLFGASLYGGLAAYLEGVPVVATLHGQVDVLDSGLRLAAKRMVFRRVISAVVAVSQTLRSDLAPLLRLPERQFRVITNGVPAPIATPDHAPNALAAPPGSPHLVAIGNIRRPKDYPTLLAALRILSATFPTIHLSIAGHVEFPEIMEELERLVVTLGLSKHVTFLGYVEDPSLLLARADCFVLSSIREGFSLVTIEAMMAGVPVVATRCGGPEEILRDGETGTLVPPSVPVELAAAIHRVLTSERTTKMTERAKRDAASRFSLDAMVTSYEMLYREFLPRHSALA